MRITSKKIRHRRDIPALAALLREDVAMRMPPEPMVFHGRAAVVDFFATVPANGALETIPLVITRANGKPAVAAFVADTDGGWLPYGLMVFDLDGDAVAAITGFPTFHRRALDQAFALRPR